VCDLALKLRVAGLNVALDALKNKEEWNMGGPSEGWLHWSYAQVESNDRVLIIASLTYSKIYEEKAPAGVGVGAAIEARRIFQQIAESKGINEKFRVVILNAGDEVGLPDQIKDYHRFSPNARASDLTDLVTWLQGSVTSVVAAVSVPAPVTLPAYPAAAVAVNRDGFVNCDATFTSFEAALTENAVSRIVMIRGHGNQGKSTLLSILYRHCRSLLGAKSVARAEFKKGGSSPEDHVRTIARSLGVHAASIGNIDERVHALLDACQQRPVVIFFDAYEHAEQHQQYWVNLVLERTLDDSLLRCVVAGRDLPPAKSQPWGGLSCELECDALKDKDAIIQHAIASGFKGKPEEISGLVSGFIRLRDRAISAGTHDHSISSQALLEELQSICSVGGLS
jgi:hypothetical protein